MQALLAARNNQQVADSSGNSLRFFRLDEMDISVRARHKIVRPGMREKILEVNWNGESETNYEG